MHQRIQLRIESEGRVLPENALPKQQRGLKARVVTFHLQNI
jgi:hypothetical protein